MKDLEKQILDCGITTEEYENILNIISAKLDGELDVTWEEIVEQYGINLHPVTIAKASNTIFGGQFIKKYFENKNINSNSKGSASDKIVELEKERKKLQTEKVEWFRKLREESREDLFEEKVIEAIRATLGNNYKERNFTPIKQSKTNRCAVLCIADQHFGKDFTIYGLENEILNTYNPEIFEKRMGCLFNEVVDYIQKNNFQKIKIFNLGDSLDGFLRHSQLWTLRYGVIESAIKYGDYMANWLKDLSRYVVVEYYQTNGNHGELRLLDGLKKQHLNENIEEVTKYIIKAINKENPNFTCIDNASGYIYTDVAGYKILGVHGEVSNLKTSIKDFSVAFDKNVDYLVAGHKHHKEFSEVGNRMATIGVGSIVGSDDYSLQLRAAAGATATMLVFEENKGKTDEHTFVLN